MYKDNVGTQRTLTHNVLGYLSLSFKFMFGVP